MTGGSGSGWLEEWIPAFAGMTEGGGIGVVESGWCSIPRFYIGGLCGNWGLFGGEESGGGSVGADADVYLAEAFGAAALVGGGFLVAVDTLVEMAAFE